MVEVEGIIPLWIGSGIPSKIWLSTPPTKGNSLQIISASEPSISNVTRDLVGPIINFYLNGKKILTANAISDYECNIPFLDLRPIGLAIHGDHNGLSVTGSSFTRNTFSGVGVMFGFS